MSLKVIHRIFFGFGGEEDIYKPYLSTWERLLPAYQIKHWNASNLPLDICPYTRALSEIQDGVFLGDYYRWWLIYKYGGVYLDADIEVVDGAKFDALINELEASSYEMIIGCEMRESGYTSHSMAGKKGARLAKFMCEIYENLGKLYLARKELLISPRLVALYFLDNKEFLESKGFARNLDIPIIKSGVKIYPKDYFSPISVGINPVCEDLSEHTCLAHHCGTSWVEKDSIFFAQKCRMQKHQKMLHHYIDEQKSLRYRLKTLPKRVFINVCFPHNSKRRKWAKSLAHKLINLGIR